MPEPQIETQAAEQLEGAATIAAGHVLEILNGLDVLDWKRACRVRRQIFDILMMSVAFVPRGIS